VNAGGGAWQGGGDPLWYKDAIVYELHVRAFFDSNGDGMGDFPGLTAKLDHLQDLGVTAVWVLPFYPSPWKDDGYDISDYTGVHEAYGSLRDFKLFMREAHRRGIRVINELVLNHTSDRHPWFQRARRSPPDSPQRAFYVWSDKQDRYKDARIIFKDFETSNWAWDQEAGQYYWHRFYSHQPDLNFDNPDVRRAMFEIVDHWLGLGVDGMRLDAVPYLFEREGTSSENLPETHAFLRELRRHVDARFQDRMLLAEANQWPEDAVAYLRDECHMAFHFPLMPRMFMSVRMEDRFPIVDILQQTPGIGEASQWAMFLRNHDELTLEMVTDEERDYMYRVYAHDPQMRINLGIRRRLAPLLGNNRRLIELMNGLLFSLPGTPVIYYGDEIGMGDNIYLGDRNGVRTPMQWSADRNAGFSRANPQRLYLPVIIDPEYHYEALNVEAQQNNPHSLLWWMKRLIALRKRYRAFGRGTLEFVYPENRKVLAFIRQYGDEAILVVANLSRYVQAAALDLSQFRGMVPVELFGRTEFPQVSDHPWFVTLGPYEFYWFALERAPEPIEVVPERARPTVTLARDRQGRPTDAALAGLAYLLPRFLPTRRWFAGKARRIRGATVTDVIGVPGTEAWLLLARVEYTDGDPETYQLPLALARAEEAARVEDETPNAVFANVRGDGDGVLYDATFAPHFARALLDWMGHRRRARGHNGILTGSATGPGRSRAELASAMRGPTSVLKGEQSNTSIVYDQRFVLKLFRRVEEGLNPDLEVSRFLTESRALANPPPLAGSLEYRGSAQPMTVGVMHGYVVNEGEAWSYTLDQARAYVERMLAQPASIGEPENVDLLDLAGEDPPPLVHELIGVYLESARILGQRTAELHTTLASEHEDPAFAPEAFTPFTQRSLYQSMRSLARSVFRTASSPHAPEAARAIARREEEVLERFARLLDRPVEATRIRIHGDFHLGQVLWTGKDFVIIDFEGEPSRPLTARRIKRSPLADVAGMMRSLHYAASTTEREVLPEAGEPRALDLRRWTRFWYRWCAAAFLRAYLDVASGASFVPRDPAQLRILLESFLLEKAVYEIGYEMNNRPSWLPIPIDGLEQILEATRVERV
jgi:maltose alpha-D-glucosyltransferase/alpha-amylase